MKAHRKQPLYLAFLLHRLSGLGLALFLPFHFYVLGLALGPTLVAASTDYIFQDTMAVAKSLALVAVVVGPIAVYLLNQGRRSYVELGDS